MSTYAVILVLQDRILKAERKKETVAYQGIPTRVSADFSKETLPARSKERSIQSHERQGPISNITLSSKAII